MAIAAAKLDQRKKLERSVAISLAVWQAAAASGLLDDEGAVIASTNQLAGFADLGESTMGLHLRAAAEAGVFAPCERAGRAPTRWQVVRPSRWQVAWRAGPANLVGQILDTRFLDEGLFHVERRGTRFARDAGVAGYESFSRGAGIADSDSLARGAGAAGYRPVDRGGKPLVRDTASRTTNPVDRDACTAGMPQGSSSLDGFKDSLPPSGGARELDHQRTGWAAALARSLGDRCRQRVFEHGKPMQRIRRVAEALADEAELAAAVAWIASGPIDHVNSGSIELVRWLDARRVVLPEVAAAEPAAPQMSPAEREAADRRVRIENHRRLLSPEEFAASYPDEPLADPGQANHNEPPEVGAA